MSWSDLPADLVKAIADELTELDDLAHFRSVCPSWRSATAAHGARIRDRARVPLLLLPTESYESRVSRRVWTVADDGVREMPVHAALGHAFLFASHHGWMLAVSPNNLTATLVYPFDGDSAGLPALPFSHGDVSVWAFREILWDWSPHGVVVYLGKGEGAFFCRPGDESWRPVGCSSSAVVTSVTYCEGSFYLFDGLRCTTTVVDAETQAVVAEIAPPPALEMPTQLDFLASLAVSRDEILLIVQTELLRPARFDPSSRPSRGAGVDSGHTTLVKAFRADRAVGCGGRSPGSWSEVAGGISDRAVFVDPLRAFCVEANGSNGVRRNCVYVAGWHEDVNDEYGWEIYYRSTVRVLDLADQSKDDLWFGNLYKEYTTKHFHWPFWALRELH